MYGVYAACDEGRLAHVLHSSLEGLFAGRASGLKVACLILQMALEFQEDIVLRSRVESQLLGKAT